jgi:hypothetical protein
MASLFGRIQRFAKSPQGRRALDRATKMAKDPRTRAKFNELRGKVAQRRAPQRPTGPSTDPKATPPGL